MGLALLHLWNDQQVSKNYCFLTSEIQFLKFNKTNCFGRLISKRFSDIVQII